MIRRLAKDGGVVGSVVGAGVGGAAFFAAAYITPKVSALQGRWWAMPAAMAALGHFAKRWSPESGQAMCGAAGALMAYGYYANQTMAPAPAPAATNKSQSAGLGYYQPAGYLAAGQMPVSRRYATEAGRLVAA